MATILLICLFIIIAGISKSIMDTVDFHFNQSIFNNIKNKKWRNWFNESEGWKNKYKDRDPKKGPAFPGSTTIFVFITDAWHFFQMIMLSSLFISMTLCLTISLSLQWYWFILIFFALKSLMTLTFELFYSKVWRKN